MSDALLAAAPSPVRPAPLLARDERWHLGVQLTVALVAGGLLLLSGIMRFFALQLAGPADLVAGAAALIIAVPALLAAWRSLSHPDLHGLTDQLVGLAVVAAWATGDLTTAALLPLVMTVGHVLEERSLLGSDEAIRALTRLTAVSARRRDANGSVETVPASALRVGDVVEVWPGDNVPADGTVVEGRAAVDTAAISGESVPTDAEAGTAVFGGSTALDGRLLVAVTSTGQATALGRIVALMRAAERAKPPVTRLLERYAGRYMLLVLLVAAASWFATGEAGGLLAVLVAACPCALVLAAPATSVAAIAVAARHGILVKGASFLEQLATTDAVVLDKTGTVTIGALRVAAVRPEASAGPDALLRVAATLGAASSHPVSRALAAAAPLNDCSAMTDVREVPGLGLVADLGGQPAALGRAALFAGLDIVVPPPPDHPGPVVGAALGGRFLGWILLADETRPEARGAVAELARLGLTRQLLLTGDRSAVARAVGQQLGIEDVRADALPADKLAAVTALVREGYRPLVVGDGVNDALALKAGSVGVAMGATGSDLALASADIVLLGNDLRRLATSIRLSRRCRRTIHVNVAVGLGWTALLIGAAAAGWLGAEGALVAAVLHNVGTLAVMANAGRLLRFQEA